MKKLNQKMTIRNINNINFIAKVKPTSKTNPNYIDPIENKIYFDDNSNKIEFNFDEIYGIGDNNESIFKNYYLKSFNKLLENINVLVTTIGPQNSGKSNTIYGIKNKNFKEIECYHDEGLIFKIYKKIFKQIKDHENIDDFDCKISMVNVFGDVIIDLLADEKNMTIKSKNFNFDMSQNSIELLKENNLEIFENNNGQILIKNLNSLYIQNINDWVHAIEKGLELNKKKIKKNNNKIKSNIITTLNFSLKDKENFNFPTINSTIQFLEIEENTNIKNEVNSDEFKNYKSNFDFFIFRKLISSIYHKKKHLEYKHSKLTKIIQNQCNSSTEILIIGHFLAEKEHIEKNIENILSFQKMKNLEKRNEFKNDLAKRNFKEFDNDEEKIATKIKEEIKQLQTSIQYLHTEQKNYFKDIAQIINLNENLELMIYKPNNNFWTKFKKQKELIPKMKMAIKLNNELQNKLELIQQEFYQQRDNFGIEQEKIISQIFNYNDEISNLNDLTTIEDNLYKESKNIYNKEKLLNYNMLLKNNYNLINEKNEILNRIPKNLKNVKEENISKLPPILAQKIEKKFDDNLRNKNSNNIDKVKVNLDNIIAEKKHFFKNILESKNKEFDEIYKQCKLIMGSIKSENKGLEKELIKLYNFNVKYKKLLLDCEGYNNNINNKIKIEIPIEFKNNLKPINRDNFNKLFELLDNLKYSNLDDNEMQVFNELTKNKRSHQEVSESINYDIFKINPNSLDSEDLKHCKNELETYLGRINNDIGDIKLKIKEMDIETTYITEVEEYIIEIEKYKKLIKKENYNNHNKEVIINTQKNLIKEKLNRNNNFLIR